MAPKRPSDSNAASGPQRKRQRMREQRTIRVQVPSSAATAGGAAVPLRNGRSAERGNGGLPPTIDVERFAQARLFEISALKSAMEKAKTAGALRAFQSLPRNQRRRAASHDVRRLPMRLRAKALSEVTDGSAKPKKKTRKILGKKSRFKLPRSVRLKKRQLKKIWLETHIWHAKRMKMTEMWGHRLAETPTEKSFRSSYRASYHGALVHDASYYQYISLEGPQSGLFEVLGALRGDESSSDATKSAYINGARECHTIAYEVTDSTEPTFLPKLLGPIDIIWQPPTPPPSSSPSTSLLPNRQILIRVHPCIARDLARSIEVAAKRCNGKQEKKEGKVRVVKLTKELLTFEITGERATGLIKSVLQLSEGTGDEAREAWDMLDSKAGPGSVPRDMIFGLEVHDPRLSFPPKMDKSSPEIDPEDLLRPAREVADLPSFWKTWEGGKGAERHPRFRKVDLDKRRSELLVPGTKLDPTEEDDRIPLLLSQRTLSPPTPFPTSTSSRSSPPTMTGWTITIPSGHGMSFFSSLVYSHSRVGGLRERSQQQFEAGIPHFPEDYPCTKAYSEWEERRRVEEEGYWERRPAAKRPNYGKLGTKNPFVDGKEGIALNLAKKKGWELGGTEGWLVTRGLLSAVMEDQEPEEEGRERTLWQTKEKWRSTSSDSGEITEEEASIYANAWVRVKVVPVGRGSSGDLACLYEVQGDEERKKLEEVAERMSKGGGKIGDIDPVAEMGRMPKEEEVRGRITTGHYSLKLGRGNGVGFIALDSFLNWYDFAKKKREERGKMLMLCRNRDGEVYRLVQVEPLL